MYSIVFNKNNSVIIHQPKEDKIIDTIDIDFRRISYLMNNGMRDLHIVFQPKRTKENSKHQVFNVVLRSGECFQDWYLHFDGKILFYTIDDVLNFRMMVE